MVLNEKELKAKKEHYQEFKENELIERLLYFEKEIEMNRDELKKLNKEIDRLGIYKTTLIGGGVSLLLFVPVLIELF